VIRAVPLKRTLLTLKVSKLALELAEAELENNKAQRKIISLK
jgi:hypothetical protein